MEWKYCGNITKSTGTPFGGVYLIVHEGLHNRVVYVGTSNHIGRRMDQHYVGYITGHRTIWRVKKDQDVYTLMSAWHIGNFINYFINLAEEKSIWASTTIDKVMPRNLLLPSQDFDEEWRGWVAEHYIPNIGIWALRIDPYNAKLAVLIESAIQRRLVKLFQLGRFFNFKDYSVLGKIEFNKSIIKIKKPFESIPDVDQASRIVFSSLNERLIPEEAKNIALQQLSSLISERLERKRLYQCKIAEVQKKYPSQWQPWKFRNPYLVGF